LGMSLASQPANRAGERTGARERAGAKNNIMKRLITPWPPTRRRPTVLVVDGDSNIRNGLVDVLHDEDCYVVQVSTGLAALEILRSFRFDLIIFDLKVLTGSMFDRLDDAARTFRRPVDLPGLLGLFDVVAELRKDSMSSCFSEQCA
jgi:CheY-like chemotaxis protein